MAESEARGLDGAVGDGAALATDDAVGAAVASATTASALPHRTMLLYNVRNAGTNMVAPFTNAALPLYLVPYGLPGWLVGLLGPDRSGVGGLAQPVLGLLSDRTRPQPGNRQAYS